MQELWDSLCETFWDIVAALEGEEPTEKRSGPGPPEP